MSRFESTRLVKRSKQPNTPVIIGISIIVVLLALVIIFVYKIVTSLWNISGGPREEVKVPDVIGLTYEEAVVKLKEFDLTASMGESVPTSDLEPGRVYSQMPEPGDITKKGREVILAVSTGPNETEVPELNGRLLAEAYNKIIKAKLQLGEIKRIYLPDQNEGIVVEQNPKPGVRVMNFSKVDITVAVNSIDITPIVPNLRGKTVQEAEVDIRNANLLLGGIEYTATETNVPNLVYDQDLPAFKKASYGSPIKIKVELPPDLIYAEARQVDFRLIVPPGKPKQHVVIKITEGNGSNTNKDYDKWHEPGYEIYQSFVLNGKATISVIINGKLIRQDILPEPLIKPEVETSNQLEEVPTSNESVNVNNTPESQRSKPLTPIPPIDK